MNLVTGPRKEFVLVVDGDCYRGRCLVSKLRALGCYASLAASAAEALRYVEENEPDVVVSDWTLPDVSGVELARRVKSSHFETKVILEKDNVDWRALREAYEVAADDLLPRPDVAGQLLTSLKRPGSDPKRRPELVTA